MSKSLWLDEFGKEYAPDVVVEDLLSIRGVVDDSWHNDVAPHFRFERDNAAVELWFYTADPNDRANEGDSIPPDQPRYVVYDIAPDARGQLEEIPDYGAAQVAYQGESGCGAVAKFLELSRLPQAVGDKFAKLLRRELTPAEFSEMRRRNRDAGDVHGFCASHDFCDANMPMAEALLVVTGCEPSFEHDAITELWNQAWDYAKREHLTARKDA
jgi:hypothetical protein